MSVKEQAMGPDQEATESDVVSDVTDSTDVSDANDVADAADGTDTESAGGVDAESTESTEDAETQKSERPTRHAMIMRGVVTPIFGLLAVAAIVLGVLNATIWKPSSEITASANVTGSRYVVTDPGVLTLLDKNTTMTVKSSSSKDETCVALASTKDAAGWVASEKSYQRISGLTSWTELGVQKGEPTKNQSGSSDDANEVAFKDSDMWTSVKCGNGSVIFDSKDPAASTVAIMDLGSHKASATISMHWVRSEVPDFAMPFYLSGGLLAVIAVLCASVFAMPPHKRRKRIVEGKATASTGPSFAEQVEQGIIGNGSIPAEVPPTGRKRRRHAAHRRGSKKTVPAESAESPTIIDPASRNLVADQQSGKAGETETMPDTESTSVISPDELQAYFSRLAQEVNDSEASDSSAADDVDNQEEN